MKRLMLPIGTLAALLLLAASEPARPADDAVAACVQASEQTCKDAAAKACERKRGYAKSACETAAQEACLAAARKACESMQKKPG